MEKRKNLVFDNYNNNACPYESFSSMQTWNLSHLLSISEKYISAANVKDVLDLGCGPGHFLDCSRGNPHIRFDHYLGIDLTPRMIEIAQEKFQSSSIEFRLGDAENLPVEDQTTDLVFSNLVLHWLNDPKHGQTPQKAFQEAYRVLRDQGLFVISLIGAGTGHTSLSVYHDVMAQYVEDESLFDQTLYFDDPIGSMSLMDVVQLAESSGFQIQLAQTHYEPLEFHLTSDFLKAYASLGYEMLMAPIAASHKTKIWEEFSSSFLQKYGETNYIHPRYMIYLVAQK